MEQQEHRRQLIHILQMAHAGELAAAFAYAGHWRSVRDREQKEAIRLIETEEWNHRRHLQGMLDSLDANPVGWRELLMGALGCLIFLGCFVSGWFLPMYFAGRLEHGNIREYENAAGHATALGLDDLARRLIEFSEVEESHEAYFFNMVRDRWQLSTIKSLFKWGPDPGAAAKAIARKG